jgi:hypothetical protein
VASKKGAARTARKKYVPSAKQLASDEKLRDELRNFDLKKFDKAMEKALKQHPISDAALAKIPRGLRSD